MKARLFPVLAVAAVLGIASQAIAGPVSIFPVNNGGGTDAGGGNLANSKTFDVKVNAPAGVDIASMQIKVQLSSGNFVEHPLGTANPPLAALATNPAFSAVPFDSFIAAGSYTDDPLNQLDTPGVFGPSLELGGTPPAGAVFSAQNYDATYIPAAGSDRVGAQGYIVARLTLSNTANGTFAFKVDFGDNTSAGSGFGAFGALPILDGVIVPEPATMSLIGLAMFGLVGLVRRRK